MKRIITIAAAAILWMAALATVPALAQEQGQDVTDQLAADQLSQLNELFGQKLAAQQTNPSSVVTPSLEFRIISGKQYTVAYPKFVAGFPGDHFEYRVLNNDACSVMNSLTNQALTWNGTPQGFTVPAVVNGLIGGNFVLKCTNSSAMVFVHIYNVGKIAVLEGQELVAPAGQTPRLFYGVSNIQSPWFSWVANGGAPGQGKTDLSGSFTTALAGAGWHVLEAAFGPDPNSGLTFRTRTAFFAQGTGTLAMSANRVGYLLTAIGGAIEPGTLVLAFGNGWPNTKWTIEFPNGVAEGGQILLIPPSMYKGRSVVSSYACYGSPEPMQVDQR